MKNKELIVLAGPTGVGKTDLGIWLARKLETEIISADSRQIYKEMRIGTAVPSKEQLSAVKHHFIQVKSVTDYYSAGKYEAEALHCMEKLFKVYDRVILLGGTGLYIDAVRSGIDTLPDADPTLRSMLQKRLETEGLGSLIYELEKLDPVSFSHIDLNNPKRVQKALEISLLTGKPYSGFLKRKPKDRAFAIRLIAVNLERNLLYERINHRVDLMIREGLEAEAHNLLKYRRYNALNTVGYKEMFSYFDGEQSLEDAVTKIKANTRKYARKQITWFRKEAKYRWFEPDQEEEILNYIMNE